ncbi:hypothetical protein [Streptomyces sp. NPDC059957]|uniref:hypothetical protein n=1 Tax=unclassified Streptomyces TaxID=2593676 RepID=UPI0036563437
MALLLGVVFLMLQVTGPVAQAVAESLGRSVSQGGQPMRGERGVLPAAYVGAAGQTVVQLTPSINRALWGASHRTKSAGPSRAAIVRARLADLIVVVGRGRLAQLGGHDHLTAERDGSHQDLYGGQSRAHA